MNQTIPVSEAIHYMVQLWEDCQEEAWSEEDKPTEDLEN